MAQPGLAAYIQQLARHESWARDPVAIIIWLVDILTQDRSFLFWFLTLFCKFTSVKFTVLERILNLIKITIGNMLYFGQEQNMYFTVIRSLTFVLVDQFPDLAQVGSFVTKASSAAHLAPRVK